MLGVLIQVTHNNYLTQSIKSLVLISKLSMQLCLCLLPITSLYFFSTSSQEMRELSSHIFKISRSFACYLILKIVGLFQKLQHRFRNPGCFSFSSSSVSHENQDSSTKYPKQFTAQEHLSVMV